MASLWVEKGAEEDEIADVGPPVEEPPKSQLKREDWMLAPPTETEAPKVLLPDTDQGGLSRPAETSTPFSADGYKPVRLGYDPDNPNASTSTPIAKQKEIEFGDAGSAWRMMKLRKCYEMAKEEGRSVEEVALERYGSIADFQKAVEERKFLDKHPRAGTPTFPSGGRDSPRLSAGGSYRTFSGGDKFRRPDAGGGRDDSRERSRLGARAEGGEEVRNDGERNTDGMPEWMKRRGWDRETPGGAGKDPKPDAMEVDSRPSTPQSQDSPKPASPAPDAPPAPAPAKPVWPPPGMEHLLKKPATTRPSSPLVPPALARSPAPFVPPALPRSPAPQAPSGPPLSTAELNKLSSRVLKAKLMKDPKYPEMQEELERERRRTEEHGESSASEPVVISAYDPATGALRDVGRAAPTDASNGRSHHNRPRPAPKPTPGTTGQPEETITQMALRERMARDTGDDGYDSALFGTIAADTGYKDTMEHLEDQVDKAAEGAVTGAGVVRERREEAKMRNALNANQKFNDTLAKCNYCPPPDSPTGSLPRIPVVAIAPSCFLALSGTSEIAPGQCAIVPREHVKNSLEMEEGGWEEVRNFMKSLIRMFAKRKLSCIFTETVIRLRHNKHTVIECFPLPDDLGVARAHFKEGILQAEGEWQQHKKLIETGERGFRRSMVKNLPYFHVWFDPTNGYGHVIEDPENFPDYFAKETLAGILELTPDQYRRPRRLDPSQQMNEQRVREWKKKWGWEAFDWTRALEEEV
ncbi:hypothetical protein M427DRAFT_155632 [Gonapodya prolifera JEL478]|uniref:Cwf19-like C-terminal domain-containing protein n=1 Tax=Gonapodya prolifera (strain JEL478) TaxID=1344416 RepID=A0A139ADY3_GONPJ|nr:hypothetical protein M427DRAFT_155632 [Gonapodya prolifera JEL478]|eukprot:KXS14970.1 hypothetical protein M427DRAFT_155632 [Gonapodya prolifera JEL478]